MNFAVSVVLAENAMHNIDERALKTYKQSLGL